MSYNHSSPFTLCRLLGLDIKMIPKKYKTIFSNNIEVFENYYDNFVVDIVGSSYDNMKDMYDKLISVKVSESNPLVIVRLIRDGREEAFDLVLVVYYPNRKVPFYIFIENKSHKESLVYYNRTNIPLAGDILEKRNQFNQTKTMMSLSNGSRDFVYIYFRTHNVSSSYVEGENNVVMELGRNEAKKFFGPSFFDLYVTQETQWTPGGKMEDKFSNIN